MLLVGRPSTYFIVANNHEEGGSPVFVFGRTLSIQEYANAGMILQDPNRFRDLVLDYANHEADLEIWSRTYSSLGVRNVWVRLDTCWPIVPSLFNEAEEVNWDMTNPAAPIDLLAEAINEFKEARQRN